MCALISDITVIACYLFFYGHQSSQYGSCPMLRLDRANARRWSDQLVRLLWKKHWLSGDGVQVVFVWFSEKSCRKFAFILIHICTSVRIIYTNVTMCCSRQWFKTFKCTCALLPSPTESWCIAYVDKLWMDIPQPWFSISRFYFLPVDSMYFLHIICINCNRCITCIYAHSHVQLLAKFC